MGLHLLFQSSVLCPFSASRFLLARIEHPDLGDMAVASLYCWAGQALSRDNLSLLSLAMSEAAALKMPTLFGGDFNMGPRTLALSGLLAKASLTAHPPKH